MWAGLAFVGLAGWPAHTAGTTGRTPGRWERPGGCRGGSTDVRARAGDRVDSRSGVDVGGLSAHLWIDRSLRHGVPLPGRRARRASCALLRAAQCLPRFAVTAVPGLHPGNGRWPGHLPARGRPWTRPGIRRSFPRRAVPPCRPAVSSPSCRPRRKVRPVHSTRAVQLARSDHCEATGRESHCSARRPHSALGSPLARRARSLRSPICRATRS